jgi:uncharacterized lipoprotein YmbA
MKKLEPLRIFKGLVFIALIFSLSACEGIGGPSTPTEFYRLTSVDLSEKSYSAELGSDFSIGVGPITIPGYANRPQIVSAGAGGRLIVEDLHHWAEPIQDNIERLLVADIASMLSPRQVFHYPTNFTPSAESLQVEVVIGEMLRLADGKVQLSASWNIKKLVDNRLIRRDAVKYISNSGAVNFEQYSEILSGLLGQLSIDMLKSISQSR